MDIPALKYWETQKYIESVKAGLTVLNNNFDSKFKNGARFTFFLLSISYAALSASELDCYYDAKRLYDKYFEIVPFQSKELPCSEEQFICHLERYLECLTYYYFNDKQQFDPILIEICECIKHRIKNLAADEKKQIFFGFIESFEPLVTDFENGLLPYYEYSFELPFAIPLPEGSYPVANIYNAINVTLKHKFKDDVVSLAGNRFFTNLTIRMKGSTSTNGYWQGPSLEMQGYEFSNMGRALEVINLFNQYILNIEPTSFISRVVINHIGNFHTSLFTGAGIQIKSSIAMSFGGNALADVVNTINFLSTPQISELMQNLNGTEPLPLYKNLEITAKINLQNGLPTEAFYNINSSFEAMLVSLGNKLCEKHNIVEHFNKYYEGAGICEVCPIVAENKEIKIPDSLPKKPPSVFSFSKFLLSHKIVSKVESRMINSLITKIRQDKERNDLMHGRILFVTPEVVHRSLLSMLELERLLLEKL